MDGDPATGCEKDEQAVQVQRVPGDSCSPACSSSGVCPSDVPSGDTAKPQCALQSPTGSKYCALVCAPSKLRLNGAQGECGKGTCESIQGAGLCAYAKADATPEPLLTLAPVLSHVETNPTHYGDPATGCEKDEQAVQVQGVSGDFCSPKCSSSGSCPTDKPSGDTATPTCALQTTTGAKYCALICQPSALSVNGANGECGTGARRGGGEVAT